MKNCKYCAKSIETGKMGLHVRHHCETYRTMKNGKPFAVAATAARTTFDPVALIDSLDCGVIHAEIEATEQRLKALHQLLTIAESNKPEPVERFNIPERFETEAATA